MEPPGRPGTSYRTAGPSSSQNTPEWAEFFSRTSPTREVKDKHAVATTPNSRFSQTKASDQENVSPHAALGQFSYAPATQTTVVTTTTTTTTSFPPFVLKAPRHLNELDSKQYPLAASPTPQSIKRFCFDFDGKPTFFREADDAPEALQKFHDQSEALKNGKVLESTTRYEPRFETPRSRAQSKLRNVQSPLSSMLQSTSNLRSRQASPVSISEAAAIASIERGRSDGKRTNSYLSRVTPSHVSVGDKHDHPDSMDSESTPLSNITNVEPLPQHRTKSGRFVGRNPSLLNRSQRSPELSPAESQNSFPAPHSEDTDDSTRTSPLTAHPESVVHSPSQSHNPAHITDQLTGHVLAATATPPIAETDLQPEDDNASSHSNDNRAVASAHLNASLEQNRSLPSPLLSPITTAYNHDSNTEMHSGVSEDDDYDMVSHLDLGLPKGPGKENVQTIDRSSRQILSPSRKLVIDKPAATTFSNSQLPTPSIMEIPAMVDSFDALPTEMQTYVMYQCLRRCSKRTLQVVADVVNPALKCDFLTLLPLELCLNILRYLDVRSLCRAAQVSKKWRHIVDSNEKGWKELFDRDGYVLHDGELEQAIGEGWGWQHALTGWDCERDLSQPNSKPNSDAGSAVATEDLTSSISSVRSGKNVFMGQMTPQSSRPKRKATSKLTNKKPQKRRDVKERSPKADISESLLDTSLDGPYAAANAAAIAIPDVEFGLPSLQNLHLFKSIYRRQYMIRKSWMTDDAKPRHIAFRAHSRHVVTCLQFDDDKIVTGSDDTNINIYDTKTGAQRNKLTGHEGGVWALQYHGNVLVSGSTDRTVRVWDIEQGKCTQVFHGHTSTVRCLQILMPAEIGKTADGRPITMPKAPRIITGSRDSNLRVWKLPTAGAPEYLATGPPANDVDCPFYERTLTGHHSSVRAIAAHGDTLVSGSYDSTVRVWRISTGETIHRLASHSSKVYSVVLDHKRNRCISGSMDYMVKVWNLETGTVLFNLEGHSSLVGLLDLSHEHLVSAAADATLRIWDPENGRCNSILSAHRGAITCFQHDWQKVISGSDQNLKMWDVKTGEFVRDLLNELSGVWQVKFNERRCVAAVQRNELTYIEVLDFGAARDGWAKEELGRRIAVNRLGEEVSDASFSDSEDNRTGGE